MVLSMKTCRWIMETVVNYVSFLGSHFFEKAADRFSRNITALSIRKLGARKSLEFHQGHWVMELQGWKCSSGYPCPCHLWGEQCSLSHSSRVTSARVCLLPPQSSSTPWLNPWLHKLMSSPLRVWIGWLPEFPCVIFRWFIGEHLFPCWYLFPICISSKLKQG